MRLHGTSSAVDDIFGSPRLLYSPWVGVRQEVVENGDLDARRMLLGRETARMTEMLGLNRKGNVKEVLAETSLALPVRLQGAIEHTSPTRLYRGVCSST